MVDDAFECVSMEGRAGLVDDEHREQWIERLVAKSDRTSPDISPEFLRPHLTVEFRPERALAVVEREEEFSTRATRWLFGT